MVLAKHHKTLHHHQQIFKTKTRIRQQILKVLIMHPLTQAVSENPQQLKIGQEATMLQVSLKTGTEIFPRQRQHNQHLKMLIRMQTGQLVTM